MEVRRYKKSDYHLIVKWMGDRNVDTPKETRLPKWGIVVGECAMVFLATTDCGICLLEYFITDPNAPKELRQEACDIGIKLAEKRAQEKGFDIIGAIVAVPRVADLLFQYEYIPDVKPYVMFRKLLPTNLERKDNGRDSSCKLPEPSPSAGTNSN